MLANISGPQHIDTRLLALKIILQSNETSFHLLLEGPAVLAIKALDERLGRLEGSESSRQQIN